MMSCDDVDDYSCKGLGEDRDMRTVEQCFAVVELSDHAERKHAVMRGTACGEHADRTKPSAPKSGGSSSSICCARSALKLPSVHCCELLPDNQYSPQTCTSVVGTKPRCDDGEE